MHNMGKRASCERGCITARNSWIISPLPIWIYPSTGCIILVKVMELPTPCSTGGVWFSAAEDKRNYYSSFQNS